MQNASDHFYSQLKAHEMALAKLLASPDKFSNVPQDWTIVITDIQNSTEAVFGGRHETVNLLATGSIVAVLNIAFKHKILLPFFFGGDGATFLIPPNLLDDALLALYQFRKNTFENFGLNLRVGKVQVSEVFAHGSQLKIAKHYNSAVFSIPIILGDGLIFAEKIIKGKDYPTEDFTGAADNLDLSGMQCRWDRISPPEDKEEIVTLLVLASDNSRQPQVFSSVLDKVETLYGSLKKRQPISVNKLRQKTTFGRLGNEMRVQIGKIKLLELLRQKLISLYSYVYLRTFKGQKYLERLVEMSDTLVLDGKINTVISGQKIQREKLQDFLDELESDKEILYGIHISNASIMSCYVRDLDDGHIHFVDGSDGGYTQAARMLKAKLAKQNGDV
ncbi:DUF3095 family protein [Flavobacterium sp.]|uniref:DUF3095 family protein n=1 Tax=Flavobacterium sp. TaxID=239 RepID=UPI0012232F81|nr:DUF3095 family protein [Flavobacterium sp.]RZJ70593.1 MAG: DUF3095 family protein [Flavobacterium sp.]